MTITAGQTWWLPKPKKGPDGTIEWYPIVRVGRHIPFGYEQDEENPHVLNPIPEQLELLEKAKLYLREYSLRQVANWLSEESGRYISHVGLQKRIAIENARKHRANNARTYARKYKEAVETAQKLEKRLGGAATASIPDDHIFHKRQWDKKGSDIDPNFFSSSDTEARTTGCGEGNEED